MKTKKATVEVTACWKCPEYTKHWINGKTYCRLHGVEFPAYGEQDYISRTDNIPNFCTLPDA